MTQPIPNYPDVIEAGRVMAELNDWRAILFAIVFILVFILLFFTIFTFWREKAMNDERKQMRELASSFAESAGKVADSLADLSIKIAVMSALVARAESVLKDADYEGP